MIKKLLLILLIIPAFAVSDVSLVKGQDAKARTFTGEITDSRCADVGSHEAMRKFEIAATAPLRASDPGQLSSMTAVFFVVATPQ